MHLTISPVRGLPGQPETTIHVAGDTITVASAAYDLSSVPEGGEATPQGDGHPFVGLITREAGVIHCTVRVLLGDTAAPNQPNDGRWVIENAEGEIAIPAERKGG